jgi:general secretion pathway protein G
MAEWNLHRTSHRTARRQAAYTLIEMLITMAIVATMMSVAFPAYTRFVAESKVAVALLHYSLPNSLAEVGINRKDPWGNPYQYLNMATAEGNGKKRKDRNLVPINTDYDLFSMGPDGKSVSPLTAKHSRDDIIRASNGAYVGTAEGY